jgi:hypothetical protein
MNFKYFLDNEAGWAGVTFESGSFSKTYMISHCLGHDLEWLLCVMIAIFNMDEKLHYSTNRFEICLDENDDFYWCIDQEGTSTTFIFSVNDDLKKTNLKIIERDGDDKCVFDGEIDINEFLDCVIDSCEDVLSKYGILGYLENFWNEFPISFFLLLKDYKKQKLVFDTFKQECPHGNVYDMHRTNFDVELEYLSNK